VFLMPLQGVHKILISSWRVFFVCKHCKLYGRPNKSYNKLTKHFYAMKKINALLLLFLIFQFLSFNSLGQTKAEMQHDKDKKDLDKEIFPGAPLSDNYQFHFSIPFEEKFIKTRDGINLNALLFKSDSSKGVIFYLHGNGDALDKWGGAAKTYTALHYDIFMLDYRGYGKSEGTINSEKQVYDDVQDAYNFLMQSYPENNIIILGYSIGTAPAAMLASNNHPEKLILQAPYYSMTDLMQNLEPSIDTTIISYKFNTYQFLQKVSAPVIIFHGDSDELIYYGSSEKLKAFFKPGDELITLKGAGHSNMSKNKDYVEALKKILQ
ncbi:MAG: alpha/beta hydrolase, partial [Ginsengibacter sp.]